MNLSETFWDNRYKNKETGWDLGEISPPLKAYINQLENKDLHILIPGGGHAYEAEYLHKLGFKNVYVVDLSKTALDTIKQRVPTFPENHLIQKDFFQLDFLVDLIIEQTFFCAIHPNLRPDYVSKASELLNKNGKIVGLLFDVPLNSDKPPFGGDKAEYRNYFEGYFKILKMTSAHNSHHSRQGMEVFFIVQKVK